MAAPGTVTVPGATLAMRLLVLVPVATVALPALAVCAYGLWWWAPVLTGPGPDSCDPALGAGACWRLEQRTLWLLGAGAAGPAAVCLAVAVGWLHRPGRWWPWPVVATVLVVASVHAVARIS